LTKSERIKLIQKIADALGQERSEIASLTLNEFGVEFVNASDDARQVDLFIARLRQCNDELLQQIAAHLNLPGSILAKDPEAEQRLWAAGFCRCFLSHTSKHKKQAAALKTELEAYGCDVFVAHEDIEPTLEWRREIETALGSCHCLLALLTDDFHGSLWTDQESGFVLGRGFPVVSIRAGKDLMD